MRRFNWLWICQWLLRSEYDVTVIDYASTIRPFITFTHCFSIPAESWRSYVKFALGTTVEKVSKINNGEDYAVTLANGQTLVADIVLSAIGLQPNISLVKLQIFKPAAGFLLNSLLETNQADIYAIGDCAEVNGTLLPYVMPIMQQARALQKH